jgi:hypothetical protein
MPRIGAILIGQSPRPDLVKPLQKVNPHFQYIESGALDFIDEADIPTTPRGDYILTTRLRNGRVVEVDEQFLFPLLQKAIADVERQGASISVLLCAGPFEGLGGEKPLYRPTAMASTIMHSRGSQRIAVLSPNETQAGSINQKWLTLGFSPIVLVDPGLPDVELAHWIKAQLYECRSFGHRLCWTPHREVQDPRADSQHSRYRPRQDYW